MTAGLVSGPGGASHGWGWRPAGAGGCRSGVLGQWGVGDGVVTVFVCGDVMAGRGLDQVLPHPGDPELREAHARDARAYVDLAERAHGRIPRPAGFGCPWGDALAMLEDIAPDVRVINLETSVTAGGEFAPGKAVHYRMSPGNVGCLTAARPDACALANNHVLDFGRRGLADTVQVLASAGLRAAGARSSCPAAPPRLGSRPAGPPGRAGPASTCCLTCHRRPPMTSSARCRRPGGPATSPSSPSTGDRTGDTASTRIRCASPAG
jgi:hypothetical protein